MNDLLIKIFGRASGGTFLEISFLSIWHIMYLVLIVGLTVGLAFLIKNKSQETKTKVLNILAIAVISVYIADFFLMPFSRTHDGPTTQLIDIDKLPFHLCTFMGVMIPFAQFVKKENRANLAFREIVVVLTVASSVMYLAFPGSAIGDIGAFCYQVVQTFVYHGLLFSWGVISLTTGAVRINFKTIWKPLLGILAVMLWATIGNFAYKNEMFVISGNWCFLRISVFDFIPNSLAPLVFLIAVFAVCVVVYAVDLLVKTIIKKYTSKKEISQTQSEK